MRAHVQEIVFDCADPAALVRFWAGLLGGDPVDRSGDWSYVDPPEFVRLAFQRVPEGKSVTTRAHRARAVAPRAGPPTEAGPSGAVRVGGLVTDEQGSFQVMRDPEGNEFCFVTG
ncbi:VOC family protein [Streptomyces sp. NPDC056501]|uniref:VOC family protein n=1 Tax=Streptomyces sp. NPDC056501 TaxID=3345841 RepID=UPI00368DEC83